MQKQTWKSGVGRLLLTYRMSEIPSVRILTFLFAGNPNISCTYSGVFFHLNRMVHLARRVVMAMTSCAVVGKFSTGGKVEFPGGKKSSQDAWL